MEIKALASQKLPVDQHRCQKTKKHTHQTQVSINKYKKESGPKLINVVLKRGNNIH
jgi:hypothetical protein